jgi:squalene cyclase
MLQAYKIGEAVYECGTWAQAQGKVASEYGMGWLQDNDTMQVVYMGSMGCDAPVYVTGTRLGDIPALGRSYNYADNRAEAGVSMATVDGMPNAWAGASAMFIAADNRPFVRVGGWLLDKRGSDGEYLVVGAVAL